MFFLTPRRTLSSVPFTSVCRYWTKFLSSDHNLSRPWDLSGTRTVRLPRDRVRVTCMLYLFFCFKQKEEKKGWLTKWPETLELFSRRNRNRWTRLCSIVISEPSTTTVKVLVIVASGPVTSIQSSERAIMLLGFCGSVTPSHFLLLLLSVGHSILLLSVVRMVLNLCTVWGTFLTFLPRYRIFSSLFVSNWQWRIWRKMRLHIRPYSKPPNWP